MSVAFLVSLIRIFLQNQPNIPRNIFRSFLNVGIPTNPVGPRPNSGGGEWLVGEGGDFAISEKSKIGNKKILQSARVGTVTY